MPFSTLSLDQLWLQNCNKWSFSPSVLLFTNSQWVRVWNSFYAHLPVLCWRAIAEQAADFTSISPLSFTVYPAGRTRTLLTLYLNLGTPYTRFNVWMIFSSPTFLIETQPLWLWSKKLNFSLILADHLDFKHFLDEHHIPLKHDSSNVVLTSFGETRSLKKVQPLGVDKRYLFLPSWLQYLEFSQFSLFFKLHACSIALVLYSLWSWNLRSF